MTPPSNSRRSFLIRRATAIADGRAKTMLWVALRPPCRFDRNPISSIFSEGLAREERAAARGRFPEMPSVVPGRVGLAV